MPEHLSANSKPIENAAGAIADGVAAALFTILLAITLLLDGEHIVNGVRRLVPGAPTRRRRPPRPPRLRRRRSLHRGHAARRRARRRRDAHRRARARRSARAADRGVGRDHEPDPADRRLPRRRRCSSLLALTQGAVVGSIALGDLPRVPAAREPRAAAADHRPGGAPLAAGDDGRRARRRRRRAGSSAACSRSRCSARRRRSTSRPASAAEADAETDGARPSAARYAASGAPKKPRCTTRVTVSSSVVGVELEPARHEEVREPFEHRHERGDRRGDRRARRPRACARRARSRCR